MTHIDGDTLHEMRYQGRVFLGDRKASGQFIDEWLSQKEAEARRQLTVAAAATVNALENESTAAGSPRQRSSQVVLFRASSVASTDSGVLLESGGSGGSGGGGSSLRRSRHNSAESASSSWRRSDLYLDDMACNGDEGVADGGWPTKRQGTSKSLDRSMRGGSTDRLEACTADGSADDAYDEVLCSLVREEEDGLGSGGGASESDSGGGGDVEELAAAVEEADRLENRRTTLIGKTDLYRTMLLQIGSDRIAFISLDKKSVILQKTFKEISYCTQGSKDVDHFGFICRDGRTGKFVMYIFQCANDETVNEIMGSLKKAFAAAQQRTEESSVCDYCPMQQLHRLCLELNGIRDHETMYNMIHNRIQNLTACEYSELMNKVKTEECENFAETNEVLMTKLRIMCELRQLDHVHVRPDISGGKANAEKELNLMGPARSQSKLESFRNRAKKAFSLDRFSWKPSSKAGDGKSRSTSAVDDEINYAKDMGSGDASSSQTDATRSHRTVTTTSAASMLSSSPPLDSLLRRRSAPAETAPWNGNAEGRLARRLTSLGSASGVKVASVEERPDGSDAEGSGGASGDEAGSCSSSSNYSLATSHSQTSRQPSHDAGSAVHDALNQNQHQMHQSSSSSWRRDIYNKVVTPSKKSPHDIEPHQESGFKVPPRRLSSIEIRALWRSAIEQTRLLNRMEQENKNLKETEQRLLQMEYDEAAPCSKEAARMWAQLLRDFPVSSSVASPGGAARDLHGRADDEIVRCAVREGVPRSRRGEVWQFLAQQRARADWLSSAADVNKGSPSSAACSEAASALQLAPTYESMLDEFTPDRHAILIDLGRTFPGHPYFRSQLGAGQLSLFNILKAYSLLDREVGYCQGLCFVAGILLMHMKEAEAFEMLKHIMFALGIRRQYKPDMAAVQVQMYQLSRLLHDLHGDLHKHFEQHEIIPSLYATPWFITLFSSQFPVGFVARVFDLLLLDGMDIVFKVAVIVLAAHKEQLLQCGSFESITLYLKTDLPSMSNQMVEKVFTEVCSLNVSKELRAYEAEYVTFEEDASTTASTGGGSPALVRRLRLQNATLHDKVRQQEAKLRQLEAAVETLQQTHAKLSDYVYAADVEHLKLKRTVSLLKSLVGPDAWRRVQEEVAAPRPSRSEQLLNQEVTEETTAANGGVTEATAQAD